MNPTKYLKCSCQNCGGHIEFPAEAVGMSFQCPHCSWSTPLTVEVPEEAAPKPRRRIGWIVAGVVILLAGVIASVTAVTWLQRIAARNQEANAVSAQRAAIVKRQTSSLPASTGTSINGFTIGVVTIKRTPGTTFIHAVGLLKNELDKQRFGVKVELDLLDGTGAKLGTASDYRDLIEPKSEWHSTRWSSIQKQPRRE